MLVPTELGVRTVTVSATAAQNQNAVTVVARHQVTGASNRNHGRNGSRTTGPARRLRRATCPVTGAVATAAKPVALSGATTMLSLKPGSVTLSVDPSGALRDTLGHVVDHADGVVRGTENQREFLIGKQNHLARRRTGRRPRKLRWGKSDQLSVDDIQNWDR